MALSRLLFPKEKAEGGDLFLQKRGILPAGVQYVRSLRPAAWYRKGIGVVTSGGLVSEWRDWSGNGRHLVQNTDTNKPTLDSDNSILFDGVDNLMQALFSISTPVTVYLLVKQVSWTNLDALCDGGGDNTMRVEQSSASPTLALRRTSLVAANGDLAVGAFGVVAAVFNGASSLLQINNGTPTTGDVGSSGATAGLTLGNISSAGRASNAAFKEVALFGAAHDAATRSRVNRYFAQVGGL